ncbi:MAG TPA: SH3 domain-containing protein [Oceanobacillus sp.]|nr:SH3 domain-containing protein [Oceanobacillus sp.]
MKINGNLPLKLLLMLSILLGLVVSAQAQPDQVVSLFHAIQGEDNTVLGGEVLFVSLADGSVRVQPLSGRLFAGGSTVTEAAISPDHRYLAITSQVVGTDTQPPVAIYDLSTDSCCVYVQPPTQIPVTIYELGAFSPDGTQLALAWLTNDDQGTFPFTGGMIIVDAATGAIVKSVSDQEIGAALGEEFPPPWAVLGDWREDGIRFHPNCYACEGVIEGEWAIWNPVTSSFVPASGEYFSFAFGAVLERTGETLLATQNLQFPASAEPSMLPTPNVISYVASGRPPRYYEPSTAPAIFFNEAYIDMGVHAEWVLDGQAALVFAPGTRDLTLLFRDGTQQPVFVSSSFNFLTGTPNGWLMLEDAANGQVLTLYTVEGAEVLATPVGDPLSSSSAIRVLDAPELGTSLTTVTPFPEIAPQFPPVSDSGTCPNLLASRLAPYSPGRVTPGAPNRLRAEPSTSSAILGEIPGGELFYVLSGPTCDDANGIVWWQVDYNGLVGWTAEGQGNTYFVEPAGAG